MEYKYYDIFENIYNALQIARFYRNDILECKKNSENWLGLSIGLYGDKITTSNEYKEARQQLSQDNLEVLEKLEAILKDLQDDILRLIRE